MNRLGLVFLVGFVIYLIFRFWMSGYDLGGPVLATSICGGLLLFGALYVWWQNKMFVTDEHIVDMDQLGLFQRTISTLRLSRVQDISVRVKGPIQTLMQYGTITIQTAGSKELCHFDYVPLPYRAKAEIVAIY